MLGMARSGDGCRANHTVAARAVSSTFYTEDHPFCRTPSSGATNRKTCSLLTEVGELSRGCHPTNATAGTELLCMDIFALQICCKSNREDNMQ